MMPVNTVLDAFFDNDAELFNVVTGLGPGDGINRIMFTARRAESIELYGARETIVSFPDAVDLADLEDKVLELLDLIAKPREEVEATVYFDQDEVVATDRLTVDASTPTVDSSEPTADSTFLTVENLWKIRIGDTIRIADRSYGFAAVGQVRELDWQDDSVRIFLGRRDYNLIDSILGRDLEDERNRKALGLPIPIGFRVQRAFPGIKAYVNQYTNSRAVGVEIHAAPMPGFTASRSTLFARGSETSYLLSGIPSGGIWYLKARSYDQQGEYSEFTAELSEVSGFLDGASIEPGSIVDITPFASGIRPPRNVLNLPLVPASGWEIDDLVVFEGRLYRLQSETGSPSNDWVAVVNATDLEGQITGDQILANTVTADNIFGNTITAAQIAVGAIGADEIDANAITAEKIAAGQVTASKINVDGSINVRSASNDGALRVLNDSGVEVLRLGGGIGGKPAVPAGVDFGLWGALGTGVFIQGAPRVVAADQFSGSRSLPAATYSAGDVFNVTFGSAGPTVISGTFTIPTGKKYVLSASLGLLSTPTSWAMGLFELRATGSGIGTATVIPAGTYSGGLSVLNNLIIAAVTDHTKGSSTTVNYAYTYILLEVGA